MATVQRALLGGTLEWQPVGLPSVPPQARKACPFTVMEAENRSQSYGVGISYVFKNVWLDNPLFWIGSKCLQFDYGIHLLMISVTWTPKSWQFVKTVTFYVTIWANCTVFLCQSFKNDSRKIISSFGIVNGREMHQMTSWGPSLQLYGYTIARVQA